MKTNQYHIRAEAAIEHAKAIIAGNQSTYEQFELHIGGSSHAYTDSASHNPKPFKGGYTQIHGGEKRAISHAEDLLREEWRALSDLAGPPWEKHQDYTQISEAADYITEKALELKIEL